MPAYSLSVTNQGFIFSSASTFFLDVIDEGKEGFKKEG